MIPKESRFKRMLRAVIFCSAVAALAIFLIDDFKRGTTEPPTARLLPDLPAYRQVEGQTITGYIGALAEGAALLTGHPQLAVTVGTLDQAIDCYQEIGGVRARVYSHAEHPLEAGLVAVADEARLNDPESLFRCVAPAALNLEGTQEPVIEPCTAAYTLVNEEGTFYIIYAASTHDVCRDFCESLEGCDVHAINSLEFSLRGPQGWL